MYQAYNEGAPNREPLKIPMMLGLEAHEGLGDPADDRGVAADDVVDHVEPVPARVRGDVEPDVRR